MSGIVSGLVLGVACDVTAPARRTTEAQPLYRYSVAGETIVVDDLEAIPPEHRKSAVAVLGQWSPDIYRYRTASGGVGYTNDRLQIPAGAREEATVVDLSHISLNHELAEDLARAIDLSYQRALASDLCRDARDAASAGWLLVAWQDHGGLMVLGATLLLLVAITPFVIRRIDAVVWAKVLGTSIALLAMTGIFTFIAGQTSRRVDALDEQAAPCVPDGATTSVGSPGTAGSRAGALETLRQRLIERRRVLDEVMRIEP